MSSIYFLFISLDFLLSGIAIACLYVCLHFSFIEAKHFLSWYVFGSIMLVASLLLLLISGDFSLYWVLAIFLFHGALIVASYYGLDALTNRVTLSTWEMIHSSGYAFTFFITLCYSCFVLAMYPRFPLTCQQLQNNSTRILSTVASPVFWGQETIENIGDWIADFFNMSVGQVNNAVYNSSDLLLRRGTGMFLTGSLLGTGTSQSVFITGTNNQLPGSLEVYKMRLFDQVVRDNTSVNSSICSVLVEEISERYNKPAFQFSVIMLLFILLYPFLRTFVWVIEGVAWLVLKILLFFGVYSFSTHVREVDDVW